MVHRPDTSQKSLSTYTHFFCRSANSGVRESFGNITAGAKGLVNNTTAEELGAENFFFVKIKIISDKSNAILVKKEAISFLVLCITYQDPLRAINIGSVISNLYLDAF